MHDKQGHGDLSSHDYLTLRGTMHERLSLSNGPIQPHSGVGVDLSEEMDA
jgi:hypothetical protein